MRGRSGDPSKLSTKPSQIRNRLRRKHDKYEQDLELFLQYSGKKPVEEWDLEELARGMPRNKAGQFGGRASIYLQPAVVKEVRRRLVHETFGELSGTAQLAIKAIKWVLECDDVDGNGKPVVDARTKLEAAKFVLEQIIGKPKTPVELEASEGVKSFIAQAILQRDPNDPDKLIPAHPVMDGQFTVNDDEEDDDDEVRDVRPGPRGTRASDGPTAGTSVQPRRRVSANAGNEGGPQATRRRRTTGE